MPETEIIDAHVHLGTCRVFGRDMRREDVLGSMESSGVSLSIVQPYPGAPDAAKVHDDIAALRDSSGQAVMGLASVNPHRDESDYFAEVKRCVTELGFVGVKLHTIGHALDPGSRDATTVFTTAHELGVPVMVHTGPGLPFADPALLISPARTFPDVQIVLAHAGAAIATGNAIAVAEVCENVVLETSWCRPGDIGMMIHKLGGDRVMFGTDAPNNVSTELAKYESLQLDDAARSAVMGGTARRVFGID
ncbi:MAG: amidohydrolase family protein [Acidimicrobiia bacterium]